MNQAPTRGRAGSEYGTRSRARLREDGITVSSSSLLLLQRVGMPCLIWLSLWGWTGSVNPSHMWIK